MIQNVIYLNEKFRYKLIFKKYKHIANLINQEADKYKLHFLKDSYDFLILFQKPKSNFLFLKNKWRKTSPTFLRKRQLFELIEKSLRNFDNK